MYCVGESRGGKMGIRVGLGDSGLITCASSFFLFYLPTVYGVLEFVSAGSCCLLVSWAIFGGILGQ